MVGAAGARGSGRSFAVRSATSPEAKLGEVAQVLGGYSSSSPAAIVARPEWRATSGGEPAAAASAATIPNASGKIDGTTVASRERQQLDEVPVLERPGEEDALAGASASSSAR